MKREKVLKELMGIIGFCKHEDFDFLREINVNGERRVYCYCNDCGRSFWKKDWVYADSITTIQLKSKEKDVYTLYFSKRESKDLLSKELVALLNTGYYYLSDRVMTNFLSSTHTNYKYVLETQYKENKVEGLIEQVEKLNFHKLSEVEKTHYNNESKIKSLIGSYTRLMRFDKPVELSLNIGKIFLELMSTLYGYDKFRYKYQWEIDKNNNKMTFNKRLKPRGVK